MGLAPYLAPPALCSKHFHMCTTDATSPRKASVRPARHRHITCACSQMLQERQRERRRSGQRRATSRGRAPGRRITIHNTCLERGRRGRPRASLDRPPPRCDGCTRIVNRHQTSLLEPSAGAICIESLPRLTAKDRALGLTRGNFRPSSHDESMPKNRPDQAGRVGLRPKPQRTARHSSHRKADATNDRRCGDGNGRRDRIAIGRRRRRAVWAALHTSRQTRQ